jgi:hypothetical protein
LQHSFIVSPTPEKESWNSRQKNDQPNKSILGIAVDSIDHNQPTDGNKNRSRHGMARNSRDSPLGIRGYCSATKDEDAERRSAEEYEVN